jgi:prophage maintenance system killer protein
MQRIGLADFLLWAGDVLDTDAASLGALPGVADAQSALAAPYAGGGDAVERAAVLASGIVRDHPLPEGNTRVAYLCMLDFMERAGISWRPPDQDGRAAVMTRLAGAEIGEAELADWLRAHGAEAPAERDELPGTADVAARSRDVEFEERRTRLLSREWRTLRLLGE